jgi:hypothetical protein
VRIMRLARVLHLVVELRDPPRGWVAGCGLTKMTDGEELQQLWPEIAVINGSKK